MALGRTRRTSRQLDYWPGFVDALSTMLLMITFLLSVFMLSQFYTSRESNGKDTVLSRLNRQIQELTSLLAMERTGRNDAQSDIAALQSTLDVAQHERDRLQGSADQSAASASAAGTQTAEARAALDREKDTTSQALARIDILNQQILALRKQLSAVEAALDASEQQGKDAQVKIADLGSRLNVALAQKVQELSRYRSDFFGRLREILGSRPGIRVVGDRFVFESQILFDSGQATLKADGTGELDKLALAAIDLEREIPPDIPWVLRVDGHTDNRPITSPQFKSNWDLSAERAIAVVQYLVGKGVDPKRLAATGFGEFQPLEAGDGDEVRSRNRRIELKLTER